MRLRNLTFFILIFVGHLAWGGSATNKTIANIKAPGGSLLSVPSTGTSFDTDSNTLTLTNKSLSGSSNTFTNIPASAVSSGQLAVANGGTGDASFSANQVILGGTTSTGALQQVSGAAAGLILTSNGTTSAPTWQSSAASSPTQAGQLQNVAVSSSVGSNAMTINLIGQNGSNPSGANPVVIGFRNATAATGTYSTISQQAALSIVIPSGASLGQISASDQYVWLYALNDAGTMDLCVSGVDVFFDTKLNATTQISAGATSGTTLYCQSAHSGSLPTTIIGHLLVHETTAGTWASNSTEIAINPQIVETTTNETCGTATITGTTTNPVKCTTSGSGADSICWYRHGKYMHVHEDFVCSALGSGTAGSGAYLVLVPNSSVIDTTNYPASTSITIGQGVGTSGNFGAGYLQAPAGTALSFGVFPYDTTHLKFFGTSTANGNGNVWGAAVGDFGTTPGISWNAEIPISGWSKFGP